MSVESRPIAPLPAGFAWGHVTGRIIHALADTSADPDKTPEARGAAGVVTFTPLGRPVRAYGVLVIHERVAVNLDADGYLVDAHGVRAPIALIIGAYSVTFDLAGGQVPGFPVEVTTAHTIATPLDLATVAPYTPPAGVPVTTLVVPASPSEGYALGWQDGKLAWLPGGGGGGVTDHGLLIGLGDDDHPQYALADGTRGDYAPTLGPDDNYVTDAEKAALHTHPAVIAQGADAAAARNAIGAGTSSLALGTTSSTAKAGNYSPPAASATAQGIVELATTTETTTGTDTTRAVTPAGVKAVADTKANATHEHPAAQVSGLATVATTGAYTDLTGAPAIPNTPDDIGAAPATHDHTAADIDSTGATDGHVLTANGAGGAAWEAPPAGGGGGSGADPWTYYTNSAEVTNDTTTYVNAAGLSIPAGLTAGVYLIDAFIVSKMSVNGPHQYQLTKPAGGNLSTMARGGRSASEVWHYVSSQAGGNISVTPSQHSNSTHSAPGAEFKATLYVPSVTTGPINIAFAPTTAGTVLTIIPGSYLGIRKIT